MNILFDTIINLGKDMHTNLNERGGEFHIYPHPKKNDFKEVGVMAKSVNPS